MGRDKALLEWQGQTFLERACATLRAVAQNVWIVGSNVEFRRYGDLISDVYKDRGPLGGIYTALRSSPAEWNLVLAVDMPLVTPALLQFLLGEAKRSAALVTAGRVGEHWQPLCGVYRREFADLAEKALKAGKNKLEWVLAEANVRGVSEAELETAGFSAGIFRNMNTQEDLQRMDSEREGG